jgi:uncharacterized protein YggE
MNHLSRYFLAGLCLLTMTNNSFCQQKESDKIVVIGSGSIAVPADKVSLRLTISFEDRVDGQSAYAQHKEQEGKLLSFLHQFNIPDSVITYSLLNISQKYDYSSAKPLRIFQTNQNVTMAFTDLSKLPAFQLALISNGYSSFEESFESSKASEGTKEALNKAVLQARVKAEIMATAAGRKIRKVLKISDTDELEPRIASFNSYLYSRMINASMTSVQLISIPQTVTIDKQVRVTFELAE